MQIISRLISSRKELDGIHTLRKYGRPISLQQNLKQLDDASVFNALWDVEVNKSTPVPVNVNRKFTFFKKKTKQPCKVVLKAPFHYKKGKHRLTLFQRTLTLRYQYVNAFTHASATPHDLLECLDGLLVYAPVLSSGSAPNRSTLWEFSLPININSLLLN